ncbi:MAG: ATP-binding protein [Clostridiales bacterium]|nr:ATP-binding protein [Clostridiales bacterium]
MELLYKKEVVGAQPQIVRKLAGEIISSIEAWHHLNEEEKYEFRLIINELIVNGIVHGNKCFCDKVLTVTIYAIDNNTVSICIKDEGRGFNYREIEEGRFPCDSALFLEGGRGLKIVQNICDGIKFCRNGSWVYVKKSVRM